jgi:DNA-directed RNA polymerase subunit M/transcription elongation factor TFIIS
LWQEEVSPAHRRVRRMGIPLTKACPECQEEMELITSDDVGEILVYECPECGYQEETRVEKEDTGVDDVQVLELPELSADDEAEGMLAETPEDEVEETVVPEDAE